MRTVVGRLSWVDRDATLVIAARATRSFAQSAGAVLIAIYLGLQGFSLVQVGTFLTVGAVGAACAAVVTGVLGDAVGRRLSLVLLSGLMALAGITLVVSERFLILTIAAFLGNLSGFIGGGGTGPLEQAVLAVSTTPRRRTEIFALGSIVGTIAGALGALASGVPSLLQRHGGLGELASFRPCFVAYAVLAVLTALLYSRLSRRVELPSGEARWTNPFTLPSRGRIFTLAGLFTVDSFGTGLIVQSLASYWFFTRFGLQPGHLGALFFASNVLTAVSLWVAARLAQRIGLLNTMVFTHIPSSLFLIAVPFVPDAWMAIALWLLRAFFAQMDAPTSQSYTMAVVAPAEQTAMASATTVTRSAGLAAGPSVGTALWTTLGPSAPFLVGGVVKIAYDLTLWRMFRQVKPPEETSGPSGSEA
jgi:MFS family permease